MTAKSRPIKTKTEVSSEKHGKCCWAILILFEIVMRPKRKMSSHEPITLIDRLGMAFLSGLIALLSAGFLWFVLAGLNRAGTQIVILPAWTIWWFTDIMAALGFIGIDNFLVKAFGKLWRFITVFW
jgi:hypothetical protein